MGQKNRVNDKRLTKKQVSEIIKAEGKLHQEYTRFFEEKYATGYIKQDKVYELQGDKYLYVFDEKKMAVGGKGDIYPKDYFLKLVRWNQRVRDDYANNRGSSVDHWRFYSKYKFDFIDHVQPMITDLAKKLGVDSAKLDCTYESLGLISIECQQYDSEQLFHEWYDHLVAYVGEVIKKRVNGTWEMNSALAGGIFPFISVNSKYISYMPINVVWKTIGGLEDIDFRKQTANEVRRNALAAKFEKDFGK
ncbi:hypothetical protein ACFFGT_01330 [Mucilaginibacter angelicae]|uniref:DUF4304 domain-containing protein n=1 Tax=Mucilaginibacter angelicae TaxID=869718 RepID=A0ABV6KZI5_9SPHI